MESNPDQTPSLDAVILAGGINKRDLYPGYRPGYKALVELDGKPLIRYVLEALGESRRVRRIGVVGSEPDLRPVVGPDVPMAPPGETLLGSIANALSLFPEATLVLLVTADLAMLQGRIVDDFVAACAGRESPFRDRLYLAVVPRERFTGVFAPCGKNFNVFRDIAVCHGNVYLATPSLARNEEAMSRINAIYAGRLSPIRSAMAVGMRVGLSYVLGVHFFHLLTLERLARVVSNRFGFGIVPVVFPHPQVAIDIDEEGDFEIARQVLGVKREA